MAALSCIFTRADDIFEYPEKFPAGRVKMAEKKGMRILGCLRIFNNK
jgi:hypothetical protein